MVDLYSVVGLHPQELAYLNVLYVIDGFLASLFRTPANTVNHLQATLTEFYCEYVWKATLKHLSNHIIQ